MVGQQEVARDVDEEVGWHETETRQDAATMIDEHIACFVTSTDGGSFSVPIFGLMVLRHGMLSFGVLYGVLGRPRGIDSDCIQI
jgi:hypothetical protein